MSLRAQYTLLLAQISALVKPDKLISASLFASLALLVATFVDPITLAKDGDSKAVS
jgi:hypothetical protein